jgi:hypothetical protein|eukprot:COSAG01_NODE_619_length_14786_cov_73.363110_10_plen_120_part_00
MGCGASSGSGGTAYRPDVAGKAQVAAPAAEAAAEAAAAEEARRVRRAVALWTGKLARSVFDDWSWAREEAVKTRQASLERALRRMAQLQLGGALGGCALLTVRQRPASARVRAHCHRLS